jgi:DNA-binding NarL/FixJ family response regulator
MSLHCLIVDDNASFLEAARALLERQGVTVVGVATTGAEGLKGSEELAPDVILVDIDLGSESGFTVAREMADRAAGASANVIFISTHAQEDFADLVADSGAVGFLAKSELSREAIERLLGCSEPA